MDDDGSTDTVAALRRKLRALDAVAANPGATPAERANAVALKQRIEQRLRAAGAPAGDWTDTVFRLGRRVKQIRQTAAPAGPEPDWTEHARRFGQAVRHGYKKWLSN
jgi:hypothetical protein